MPDTLPTLYLSARPALPQSFTVGGGVYEPYARVGRPAQIQYVDGVHEFGDTYV
ncbi:hypothetical protein ACQPWW_05905 [Micromonospora sp. CA-240977]|uniref:hypothetical protein n=1 Tax=Micromonospora sp. CA-240977 TaxID=3239957 RepID=UPI003D8E63F8